MSIIKLTIRDPSETINPLILKGLMGSSNVSFLSAKDFIRIIRSLIKPRYVLSLYFDVVVSDLLLHKGDPNKFNEIDQN